MDTQQITSTAPALKDRLEDLEAERALAPLAGLEDVESYMEDLLAELEATRDAYVGAAVTEIASLRAALGGPLEG